MSMCLRGEGAVHFRVPPTSLPVAGAWRGGGGAVIYTLAPNIKSRSAGYDSFNRGNFSLCRCTFVRPPTKPSALQQYLVGRPVGTGESSLISIII